MYNSTSTCKAATEPGSLDKHRLLP